MTSKLDRQRLLEIARNAIVSHVAGMKGATWCQPPDSAALCRKAGAFVTISREGDLRGCIGHLEADMALWAVVCECAVAACHADPRFPPVHSEELSRLVIEVSLLGPIELVKVPEEIQIGRDGLIVEQAGQRGLLLPQVAPERQWDREAFLSQTCRKAGLPRDAWRHGARIWRFEAEVFGEDEFRLDLRDVRI